jgi:hypothetical protein
LHGAIFPFGVFMRRNVYIIAFVAVLLVACIGGFLAARVFFARMQDDFALRPEATPAPSATVEPVFAPVETAEVVTEEREATATPRPTSTVLVVAAPVTDQPQVLATPQPTWTAGVVLPTSDFVLDPLATLVALEGTSTFGTPEPSVTPFSAFAFALARPVRYSSGDCPGTYALGLVTDRNGGPLPGVRLSLVDEYGNATTAVTKPGPGDTGRYDFPMGGPPRRFYLTIVDEAGRSLSPRVEILHDLAPQEGNGCRWVDWQRN